MLWTASRFATGVTLLAAVAGERTASAQIPVIRPDVVVLTDTRADSGAAHLVVAVRDLRSPSRAIQGAQLSITSADSRDPWGSLSEILTDSTGLVLLTPSPGRELELRVRRLGALAVRVRLTVPPGCISTLELYLVYAACDIGGCPALPMPRAVLTTCRPRAA